MTAHLQFKFMYLKEIFSVTLISLQKVRGTLLQARRTQLAVLPGTADGGIEGQGTQAVSIGVPGFWD